jgi:hypothetical protein
VHSDTLGWIFGLLLMFGIPILILMGLGWAVTAPAPSYFSDARSPMHFGATLLVRADRDSVHAGDDSSSHMLSLMVGNGTSLAGLVEQIRGMGFLPSIYRGRVSTTVDYCCVHDSVVHLGERPFRRPSR